MLRQFGDWIPRLPVAAVFDVGYPSRNGKRSVICSIGRDWFIGNIYDEMISVEIQSMQLSDASPVSGTLSNAKFKLQIGRDSGRVTVNGAYADLNALSVSSMRPLSLPESVLG